MLLVEYMIQIIERKTLQLSQIIMRGGEIMLVVLDTIVSHAILQTD